MSLAPTQLLALGLAAAFLAVSLLGVRGLVTATERRQVNRSLRALRASALPATAVRDQELAVPLLRRLVLPGLATLGRAARRLSPPEVLARLDRELVRAGSPAGWDAPRLLAVRWLSGGVLALLGVVALPLAPVGLLRAIVVVPVLALVGSYVPEWVVRSAAGRRQEAIRRTLPDALDLLSITVEAGLGFDAALDRVSRELGGPLGAELGRVVQEVRLGSGRATALRELSERTTVEELRSFVLAMIQADIFGISIASVLRVQAGELRVRRRQRAEETAQRLPVKLVFPLVLCIFPALFVILLGPAVIAISESILTR